MSNLVPGTRGGNLAGLSSLSPKALPILTVPGTLRNLITYDGAPATRTRSNEHSLGSADWDSTQEIQILAADYLPEYGRTSGGQVRITPSRVPRSFTAPFTNTFETTPSTRTPGRGNHVAGRTSCRPSVTTSWIQHWGTLLHSRQVQPLGKNKIFWYWARNGSEIVFRSEFADLPRPVM